MKINERPQDLKVGDKITSDFFTGEEMVVRTITKIYEDVYSGSKRGILFDAGERCPCCGKYAGTDLDTYLKNHSSAYIDAAWAVPIK